MKADQKEKCLQVYYHTDIEPTLDRLNQIKDIVSNFEKDGANRLTCALEMKHKDLDEIEKLSEFIAQAREKMEKELERLKKLEPTSNMLRRKDLYKENSISRTALLWIIFALSKL